MWAVIGGSGFEKFDGFKKVEDLKRETPFGLASSGFKKVIIDGKQILFIPRHGEHHELCPSEVNYRANIYALKAHGAKAIMSFSAVGSLRAELKPGDMVMPFQYIDRTKSIRPHTFCGDGLVGHVSLAHPVCEALGEEVRKLAAMQSFDSHFGKTYICIEGPTFSTLAESNYYRFLGADIIGMTNYPEYALAREAGLSYIPSCWVTDYDCWDQSRPHVTVDEVLKVMRENNGKAFALLQSVLQSSVSVTELCDCREHGLKNGLMTPLQQVSQDKQKWLEILLS